MKLENKLIQKIENITMTKYENKDGEFEPNEICCMLEDLINMYDGIETKYNDLERNLQDNYKKISVAEQVE